MLANLDKMRQFGTYLLLASALFSQSSLVNSIKVNSDGGYEVLLAIDEDTPEPTGGIPAYVNNIEASLKAFSSRLFLNTNKTFYLKSVDILLPSNWNATNPSATTQSYQAADIRISSETAYPHAENPYPCGQPGNVIDLPQSFFNSDNSGPFGVHAKSLLHLWALYRFGVHPEHGILGDSRYPYSVWDRENEQLSITGCSDEPIKGKFVDITNADATCDSEESASNENCRFVPDAGQNATSSLLFFHFIDTVEHFCDSHNHNKNARNQQNDLCNHKSVWEVIRETADYRAVTDARLVQPPTTINVVQTNPAPLFYLLLDRGQIQGSLQLVNLLNPLLAQFISQDEIKNNIASIGAFPGENGSPLKELVPWSQIGQNLDTFIDNIGSLSNNGPLERDFSRALVAVADEIKQKNHPAGAVVLVVKYGADVASIGSYLPESEVINALGEANIVLHSLELTFPGHNGLPHLAPICRETGGIYAVLDAPGEVSLNTNFVLSYVTRMTKGSDYYHELHREWKTIHKDAVSSTTIGVRLASNIKGTFQMFVSSSNGALTSTNFTVAGYNSTSGTQHPLSFRLRKSQDWNEGASKHTYRLEINESDLDAISVVSLLVTCATGNCANSMFARAEFTGDINKVKIDVQTSVENNAVDLASGIPVSIFAKVTKSGVPVDNARVIVSLKHTTTSIVTPIRLNDDGLSTPDTQTLDGIYSAFFAPERDGQYELSISVQGTPVTIHNSLKDANIQLLPIDQTGDLGCGGGNCNSEKLEEAFSQALDISAAFSVLNAAQYIPTPTKIVTLGAANLTNQDTVYFDWLSPVIPGRQQSVSSYELRVAPQYELLVTNFDEQDIVPLPPTFTPGPPADLDSITIAKPRATAYYAIRSVYMGKQSVPSNIVEVVVENIVDPPPPPASSTEGGDSGTVGMTAFSGMTFMAVSIVFLKSFVL